MDTPLQPGTGDARPPGESTETSVKKQVRKKRAPRPPRPKIDAAELEARLSARAERRRYARESRTPQMRSQRRRGWVTAALTLSIVGCVIGSAVMNQIYLAEHAQNTRTLRDMQKELRSIQDAPEAEDMSGRLVELSESAAAAAQLIASHQQRFVELHHEAGIEPGEGNGVPNAAAVQIVEHRRSAEQLFSAAALHVPADEAYSLSSIEPFDTQTEIDPRFPWYIRYADNVASAGDVYGWEVGTVMPRLERSRAGTMLVPTTAQVSWLCRDRVTGEVLAWASATFRLQDGEGSFDDVRVVMSAAGASYRQAGTTFPPVPELSDEPDVTEGEPAATEPQPETAPEAPVEPVPTDEQKVEGQL